MIDKQMRVKDKKKKEKYKGVVRKKERKIWVKGRMRKEEIATLERKRVKI